MIAVARHWVLVVVVLVALRHGAMLLVAARSVSCHAADDLRKTCGIESNRFVIEVRFSIFQDLAGLDPVQFSRVKSPSATRPTGTCTTTPIRTGTGPLAAVRSREFKQ
ncbi:expressed unknown protein [Seminavis robusta]|uniref:Secreted protein n=1 Tax=Seminavis robusta TaxID=568900 RepID=A0A9N8HQH2_9STRA|nr:expressed unknown protein [Seminavis robusta]|eukprot:Sro1288_g259562.1  (108) ;mRNA; f:9708-10031